MPEQLANPYDFRAPVRYIKQLGGRWSELEQVDEFLRSSAAGSPVHFSLFGPAGVGKSSLLNAVCDLALERSLLPVKLDLQSLVVESEGAFYGAVMEAGLDALVALDRLDADGPLLRSWRRNVLGDERVTPEDQPFELGAVLAAHANGRRVQLPAPMLRRDLQRLFTLGDAAGLVLCLDASDELDQCTELAPSLMSVAEDMPCLTLVTAGMRAGKLQESAPRAWAQVAVGPFTQPAQVFDAIARPLRHVREKQLELEPATAADVLQLTGGSPYEITLVSHFVWDEVRRGELREFELSASVIERVRSELEEKGRHGASEAIARLSSLPAGDVDVLARLAPYEALTVRQIALLRLMFDDYSDGQLSAEEETVRAQLARLQEHGVLSAERDRFEFAGGDDARLYLKYAAKRRTGSAVRFDGSYERTLTFRTTDELGAAVLGESYSEAILVARGRPFEMGGTEVGRSLEELCSAVAESNVVALSDFLGGPFDLDELLEHRESGAVLFGLVMQIGVHEVEHIEFLINEPQLDAKELSDRASSWLATHTDLLAKYNAEVRALRCLPVSPELTATVVAYAQLQTHSSIAVALYRAGVLAPATKLLQDVIAETEKLVGVSPGDPLVRAELADVLLRAGFITLAQERWTDALHLLDQSAAVALSSPWVLDFNRGYVHARLGDHRRAVNHFKTAASAIDGDDQITFLFASLPAPPDWEPPTRRWNAVELRGNWAKPFVELQLKVAGAQADPAKTESLREALHRVAASAPPPVQRLAGWAALTLLGAPDRAVELFNAAVGGTPFKDVAVPRAELEYATARAAGQPAAEVQPGVVSIPPQ